MHAVFWPFRGDPFSRGNPFQSLSMSYTEGPPTTPPTFDILRFLNPTNFPSPGRWKAMPPFLMHYIMLAIFIALHHVALTENLSPVERIVRNQLRLSSEE